jgi:hypothetical protein
MNGNGGAVAQRVAFRVRNDLFPVVPVQTHALPASKPAIIPPAQMPNQSSKVVAEARPYLLSQTFVRKYLIAAATLAAAGVALVFEGNRQFNAPMYDENGMLPAAEAFARGENYANFDLNINIRKLRDLHIARMTETPDVVLFGASHWQEAHKDLLPGYKWYNSHIHREFWQDLFAMTYMWESHDRLPKKLIIALRDNIFAPIESRPDYLWEPGIPYWRAMADKMGIEKESWWRSYAWHRIRERFSFSMLYGNIARWANSGEQPHASKETKFSELDVILPDGSVLWSQEHMNVFTPERTLKESLTYAEYKIKHPPLIEQKGVENFDKLLKYLTDKGVTIYFAQPPYNPQFWDKVQGTAYMEGLKPVLDVQNALAAKYGIKTIGSFNPHDIGCVRENYIDSEHANPDCLKHIFNQFAKLDAKAAQ